MKKIVSIILCALMLLPFFSFASAAEDSILTVNFSNDLRGSAAGEYTFTTEKTGVFELIWADKNGEALKTTVSGTELSYTALTEFTVKKAGSYVFEPQSFTAIPYGAEKAIVKTKSGGAVASFDLPKEKLLEKEQNYAYGMLSDLHFNTYEDDDKKDQSVKAVDAALAFFKSVGVQYVFETGDISTNADETAYKHFADCVERSGLTFLACGGNHEVVAGYDGMYGEKGIFYKYVNKGVYDGTLEGVIETCPTNKHDFIYQIPGTNDIFIAISQVRWDSKAPSQKPLVEPETLDWFESMLEKHKDKKAHLLMHTFLADDDYTHVDGEGDISNLVGYGYNYFWNIYSEEDARLRRIFDKYEDLIWFNGHSHWIIEMQKYNKNLNIYDYEGTTSTMIHIPSVTAPRTINDTEDSYHSNVGSRSEGVLMFSCDGYELENAIDFKTGKIYAYGCYIVYDRADKAVSGSLSEDGKTVYTFDKQLSSLRVTGTSPVKDLAGASDAPWRESKNSIRTLYIGKDVPAIGKNVFAGLSCVNRIEIKNGVKEIGENAFEDCISLETLFLPETLEKIGENAFTSAGEEYGPERKIAVTYDGTPEQFDLIDFRPGNENVKTADVSCLKRIITWKIGSYIRNDCVAVGSVPTYGDSVSEPSSSKKVYKPFTGWSNGSKTFARTQTLPKVTKNATYTAVFGDESERFVEGSAGKRATWSLDRLSGTLTISGRNDIDDYDKYTAQPWNKYANEIYTVVVKSGINKVGHNAFSHLNNLTTIVLEDKVRTLGTDAFAYCDNLTDVYLPGTLQGVSQGASYQCNNVKNIYFGGTEEYWNTIAPRFSVYNEILKDAKDIKFGVGAPTSEAFTVTFVDSDGTVLKEYKNVAWCDGVQPPEAPERENEEFLGWDTPYFIIKGDTVVTALYLKQEPAFSDEEFASSLPFGTAELIGYAAAKATA